MTSKPFTYDLDHRGVGSVPLSEPEISDMLDWLAHHGAAANGRYHFSPRALHEAPPPEVRPIAREIASGEAGDGLWTPPGVKLLPHQPDGARFLVDRRSALLADDLGLGKSLMAICAAETVRRGEKVLILCPSGLTGNWKAELAKWAPGASAAIQTSTSYDFDVAYSIVSYDTAKSTHLDAITEQAWGVLILDEAHRVKNATSLRHMCVMQVTATRRWLLSGAPMLNRPMDVFGLLRAGGHPLGGDLRRFQRDYLIEDRHALQASQMLGERISSWALRRLKSDVLDLPGKTCSRVVAATNSYAPRTLGELASMRALLAVEKARTTVDLIYDTLASAGEAVVVFSCSRRALDLIGAELTRYDIEFHRIDGSVHGPHRQRIVDAFQSGRGPRVLLGQIIAAGEGLTLTRARHVIVNDLSYVPAEHTQAEDRCYRIGQEHEVTVRYVISDCALDRAVWSLLEIKRRNILGLEGAIAEGSGRLDPVEVLNASITLSNEHIDSMIRVRP